MANSTIQTGRLFHFENPSGSATIGGSTNGSIDLTLPIVAGFTPVGIVGVTSSHGANFCITTFRIISGTAAQVVLRNVSSSSATVTITAKVLYAPSNMTI